MGCLYGAVGAADLAVRGVGVGGRPPWFLGIGLLILGGFWRVAGETSGARPASAIPTRATGRAGRPPTTRRAVTVERTAYGNGRRGFRSSPSWVAPFP
jgi:hypothetical protein